MADDAAAPDGELSEDIQEGEAVAEESTRNRRRRRIGIRQRREDD